MTGYFVRIERDGKWQPVEVDQMTDQELEAFFSDSRETARRWAIVLAKWIRENVKGGP